MVRAFKDIVDQLFTTPLEWHVRLAKEWISIMGPLANHVRLERVAQDNTVILGVYDVHWMQELYLLSRTIARTINTYLEGEYVNKIHFKLVQRPEKNSAAKKHEEKKEISVRDLTFRERKALENIHDDSLKLVLQAFLERSIRIQGRGK